MLNKIISSYPNKYFKSKHERFKDEVICACKCDCDMIITMIGLKKGDICPSCKQNDHAYPVYKKLKCKHDWLYHDGVCKAFCKLCGQVSSHEFWEAVERGEIKDRWRK